MPPADPVMRLQIEAEAAAHGWPWLHAQLAEVDPDSAARIHPNHSQRLNRALEVYRASGVTLSQWQQRQQHKPVLAEQYRVVQLAICPQDRSVLHERIALRFRQMMADGLLNEVTDLYLRGDLHADRPAMRAVGYRQLWQYLAGVCTLQEAVSGAVSATRQLAKRHLTWIRKCKCLACIYSYTAGNLAVSSGSDISALEIVDMTIQRALNYLDLPPI